MRGGGAAAAGAGGGVIEVSNNRHPLGVQYLDSRQRVQGIAHWLRNQQGRRVGAFVAAVERGAGLGGRVRPGGAPATQFPLSSPHFPAPTWLLGSDQLL